MKATAETRTITETKNVMEVTIQLSVEEVAEMLDGYCPHNLYGAICDAIREKKEAVEKEVETSVNPNTVACLTPGVAVVVTGWFSSQRHGVITSAKVNRSGEVEYSIRWDDANDSTTLDIPAYNVRAKR